jgi:large repetitive protein
MKGFIYINHKYSAYLGTWLLMSLFLVSTQKMYSQCAAPSVGCPNTNLANFGFASDNNAATIEYDNFVSSFHSTIVRTSDGSFKIWGENMGNNGVAHNLSPLTLNATNSALGTSTVLKATLGSWGIEWVQGIVLSTNGLYAWGLEGVVIDPTITTSATFQKLTIGGNANGLPTGVVPADVKMMFATNGFLAITTCSGNVWVLSKTANERGNGGGGSSTAWSQVTTSAVGNPALTNVVACRGSYGNLMALTSTRTQ